MNLSKKILVGVCGIGNGHSSRQKILLNHLLQHGHEIVLFLNEENKDQFDIAYPQLQKIVVKVPWVYCDKNGIDFEKTRNTYLKSHLNWYAEQLSAFIKVKKAFKGLPNVIITDYEPNSAQFSYATGIPLICFEQQSKFLGYDFENIGNYSPVEEIRRLLYFFPHARKRYVSSFFPLKDKGSFNVESIPPIVNEPITTSIDKLKVIVYFSPYGKNDRRFVQILKIIKQYSHFIFHIYSDQEFHAFQKIKHLVFHKIDDQFRNNVIDCNFIISTAGHQLISEAINMEKPIILCPFNTFEQHYNVRMVEKYSLGIHFNPITVKSFNKFITNLDLFRMNMKHFKKRYWKKSWQDFVKNILITDDI